MPRKNLLVLVLATSFAACAGEKRPSSREESSGSASSAVSSAHNAALRSLYAARASDARAVGAAYAEDAVKVLADGTDLRGRAVIVEGSKQELAQLVDARYAASRTWSKGDTTVAEEAFVASAAGHPERRVGARSLNVYVFDAAGLIKEHRVYENEGDVREQLAGAPDAAPVPALPTSTVAHVDQHTDDDAASAAWLARMDAAWAEAGESLGSLVADDIELTCTLGSHTKGKREFLEKARTFGESFADQKFTTERVWAIDGFVIAEHTMRATYRGRLTSSPRPIVWRVGEVFELKAGKVTGDWAFLDFRPFARQVGLP